MQNLISRIPCFFQTTAPLPSLWAAEPAPEDSIEKLKKKIAKKLIFCLKAGNTFSDGSTNKIGSPEGGVKLVGSLSLVIMDDFTGDL